jgi:hypothetical protein
VVRVKMVESRSYVSTFFTVSFALVFGGSVDDTSYSVYLKSAPRDVPIPQRAIVVCNRKLYQDTHTKRTL